MALRSPGHAVQIEEKIVQGTLGKTQGGREGHWPAAVCRDCGWVELNGPHCLLSTSNAFSINELHIDMSGMGMQAMLGQKGTVEGWARAGKGTGRGGGSALDDWSAGKVPH